MPDFFEAGGAEAEAEAAKGGALEDPRSGPAPYPPGGACWPAG